MIVLEDDDRGSVTLRHRIADLERQVFELRQSLIGGIEGVRRGKDLRGWAEANDRMLREHRGNE